MKSSADSPGIIDQLKQNPIGLKGFLLSVLQLLVHGSWVAFATWLTSTGEAKQLPLGSWQYWCMTILMLTGAVLTMISLFMCLYGAIHGRPRTLAIIGFSISFFIGALTTSMLALSYLAKQG